MSRGFTKKWTRENAESLATRLKKTIKPSSALKQRLNLAIRHIESQIKKLNRSVDRFSKRDKTIFDNIVKAYSKQDTLRARILANELAEIRKVEKALSQAKLALESISFRLKTVSEFGDVITILAPAVKVLNNVKSGLSKIFPEAEAELGNVGEMLNEIVTTTSQQTGLPINFEAANEEAKKILQEAASISEKRIKERLPELPAKVPAREKAKLKA